MADAPAGSVEAFDQVRGKLLAVVETAAPLSANIAECGRTRLEAAGTTGDLPGVPEWASFALRGSGDPL